MHHGRQQSGHRGDEHHPAKQRIERGEFFRFTKAPPPLAPFVPMNPGGRLVESVNWTAVNDEPEPAPPARPPPRRALRQSNDFYGAHARRFPQPDIRWW